MKINNKGLTLVELIIAFVILVMFLFGMLEIVLSIKSKASDELFSRDMVTFKDTLIKTIEDDLIKKELVDATCTDNTRCTFNFKNDMTSNLTINKDTKTIEYNGIKYEIPNPTLIYFGTVELSVSPITSDKKILKISIPYYEAETTTPNYGIKILHPYVNN